ncbi:MAG: fibronectin type III domain-containing protein [Clostridia bacterium]|nr:fibronectin type III domain-containing protein [Clostridia bacterium]
MKSKRSIAVVLAAVLCLGALIPCFTLSAGATSLADYEKQYYYKPGPSPMEKTPTAVTLKKSTDASYEDGNWSLCLDGKWKMLESASAEKLAGGDGWEKAYEVTVPGSIYTALTEAGVIEDPYLSDNMKNANRYSKKSFCFLRTFNYEGNGKKVELDFAGVCNVCDIYLNGKKIASHEGMFGGPYVDVTDTIRQGENILLVYLKPAKDYTKTVVFNCSYGWHYAELIPLGIWQSVTVRDVPAAEIDSPFITTVDHERGTVDMSIDFTAKTSGTLYGRIAPKNFEGDAYTFTYAVKSTDNARLRTDIPDPHLWWPNGYGEQNLYTLELRFEPSDGGAASVTNDTFGIRTLEYKPFPTGEQPGMYNRTFVINGKEIYFKGAGWCTIDAQMRFSREDYDRILSRAHDAGINFFRAWGGGLIETDEFYDLCDEYGICVYQEWPCCWDSQKTQPQDVLDETITLNTKRLRNRASLVVYGGGNEGEAVAGDKVMDRIGKMTYELDGTREFWRQDGGYAAAGIRHDHIHWSGDSPEYYLGTYSRVLDLNFHEFGLDSLMNADSIAKYATAEEMAEWPLSDDGTVAYHTATFNGYTHWAQTPYGYDMATFEHYAGMFTEVASLDDLIVGSQLAQAQADYLPSINSRLKFPHNTANVIYKMNDVYPGGSWSIVDWYGAPKIGYYLMQDAYRPLMAAARFDGYNFVYADGSSKALSMPVYVLDDNGELDGKSWSVTATAYGSDLSVVTAYDYNGMGHGDDKPVQVGTFSLTAEQTNNTPLILTFDLYVEDEFVNRTYAYCNFEQEPGCLFWLPRTELAYTVNGNEVTVTNKGKVPALSVHFDVPDTAEFVCSDGYFLLAPGESQAVTVNDPSLIRGLTAFNMRDTGDTSAPKAPHTSQISNITNGSATLSWAAAEDKDDGRIAAYHVFVNDQPFMTVHGSTTSCVLTGLDEATAYSVRLQAEDAGGNLSPLTTPISFTTVSDTVSPAVASFVRTENGVTVNFDKPMDGASCRDLTHYLLPNGVSVTNASLSENGKTLVLTGKGFDQEITIRLGLLGLRDASANHNPLPYTELVMEAGVYLTTDLDGPAPAYRGKVSGSVTLLRSGVFTGTALDSIGGGASFGEHAYTFNNGTSIAMTIDVDYCEGYMALIAKGEKTTGHFEFYLHDYKLWSYIPEIRDIDFDIDVRDYGDGPIRLVFVRQDDFIDVYVNGELASYVSANGRITPITAPITIGCLNDQFLNFAGTIDDVTLYDRALSEEEIAAMNNSSEVPVFSSPVLTLTVGDTCPLGLTPDGCGVTVDGDAVSVTDGIVKAEKTGTAIITAERGSAKTYLIVDVVEVLPKGASDEVISVEEPTEPETEPVTEPVTEPAGDPDTLPATQAVTEPDSESGTEPSGNGCKSMLSGAAVILALLPAALWAGRKKKE